MKKILFIFAVFLSFYPDVPGQSGRYVFDDLSIGDGLSHNTVNCIIKDRKGFIWIGTNDGLNRYDGYSFLIFKSSVSDTNSISNNRINTLYEDSYGRLWVGTRNGLNVFNPEMQNFKRYMVTSKSQPDQTWYDILTLYEDRAGNFLVGTYGEGLFRYDPLIGRFKKIEVTYSAISDLSGGTNLDNFVSSIFQDREKRLWVGTNRTGINLFNPEKSEYTHYSFCKNKILPTSSFRKTIYQDFDGEIWICSAEEGIFRFDPSDGTVINYRFVPGRNSLSNNLVRDIYQDRSGLFWLATDGGGINLFDKKTGKFTSLRYDPGDQLSLSSNAIYIIYQDNTNVIWIGTVNSGISIYDPNKKHFRYFTWQFNIEKNLSHRSVSAFAEDNMGNLWIGTEGGGLNYFNVKGEEFSHFISNPQIPGSLSSNNITSLLYDKEGTLWVGTWKGGLNRFYPSEKRFKVYRTIENNPHSLKINDIWDIYQTSDKKIWLGTSGGLELFNPKNEMFIHYPTNLKPIGSYLNMIRTIFEDNAGNLWLGGGGLWVLDKANGSFIDMNKNADGSRLFIDYFVSVIFQDSHGNIWIGTNQSGIFKLDTKTWNHLNITSKEGLPNDAVHSILEDSHGYLWISTNKGICRFDPEKFSFRNFDVSDGLQSNQFSSSVALKAKDGKFYFGGIYGFNVFHPDSIRDNTFIPPVVITGFRLFNTPVKPGAPGSLLSRHISETNQITLNHSQSVISFEFTALNFTSPEKNQYEYIMEGFESEWNKAGIQRIATYTNLDPGKYTFRVRGSNNDGIWNETGASVNLTILPPFYKTKFAFVIYFLLFLLLLFLFRNYILIRARMKNEIKLKELEKQQVEEVNQMKMKFFTNISHEFRTPLSLILSPLEKLVTEKKFDNSTNHLHALMYRNASRLLRLINQLMDLRKIEKGSMNLRVVKGDIVTFLKENKSAFDQLAADHQVKYTFKSNVGSFQVFFDPEKVEKILYNLLSNAFRFTPDNGKISIRLNVVTDTSLQPGGEIKRKPDKKTKTFPDHLINGFMEISVTDSGAGIPFDEQEKIFDRFYQIENKEFSRGRYYTSGTGIGLSLVKDLTEIHRGIINLKSQPGSGSSFSLVLPIDPSCYSPDEIDASAESNPSQINILRVPDEKYVDEGKPVGKTEEGPGTEETPIILVVEDNPDIRDFIRLTMEPDYRIVEAGDGKQGFEKARDIVPDLIISDIMMPVTDGIVMAGMLKEDEVTNHIPIIFLTAKSGEGHQLEGLETGGEDYIVKPFNPKILTLKIRNILSNHSKIKQKIKKQLLLEPSEVNIESVDDKFLKRAVEIVEKNISEPEFDVMTFAQEIGMSRSVLYRKIQAVTDQPVNEFINTIRLKRAALLLSKKSMNISEVSFSTGFNDPQYFSKCFKKQYGMIPTQYTSKTNIGG